MAKAFEEIAHSGGKILIGVVDIGDGSRGIEFTYKNSRPVRSSVIGLYVVPPGLVVGTYNFDVIGDEGPPVPESIPVLIGSDSEGQFGHNCPNCEKYWRSGSFPQLCPYCGVAARSFEFLSLSQRLYIEHYCAAWKRAAQMGVGTRVEIDLDLIADATLQRAPKPEFYISDERQQTRLDCASCGSFNDIMGRFGYCSVCGTRNDLEVLTKEIVPAIHARLTAGYPAENALRDAVSAFDVFLKQYAGQLLVRVPMTATRRKKLAENSFGSIDEQAAAYRDWFDIDLQAGISAGSWADARRMFLRRHVYEHHGGVVDDNYLRRSGDTTVRQGEHISEKSAAVHEFVSVIVSIAKRLHEGFHSVIPVNDFPIEAHRKKSSKR